MTRKIHMKKKKTFWEKLAKNYVTLADMKVNHETVASSRFVRSCTNCLGKSCSCVTEFTSDDKETEK